MITSRRKGIIERSKDIFNLEQDNKETRKTLREQVAEKDTTIDVLKKEQVELKKQQEMDTEIIGE